MNSVSILRVTSQKGRLAKFPGGSPAMMAETMGVYARNIRKQPLSAPTNAVYKKYGLAAPEMAAEGFAMPRAHRAVRQN